VLPVLPVVLASGTNRADRPDHAERPPRVGQSARAAQSAGAWGNRWRPYGAVAGLVIGFSGSVLFGTLVLSALHLPQELLRDAGVVVLVVIGLRLLVPRLADLLARPFERLPQRRVDPDSNGIVLGLGLGLFSTFLARARF
jgi:cytochrome c biogenesis protein CcdA